MNTTMCYTYTDASGYTRTGTIVLAGLLDAGDEQVVRAACELGRRFIPHQVGLRDLQGEGGRFFPNDHVWHELGDAAFTATTGLAGDLSADELVRRFQRVRWDATAAAQWLGLPGAQVPVPVSLDALDEDGLAAELDRVRAARRRLDLEAAAIAARQVAVRLRYADGWLLRLTIGTREGETVRAQLLGQDRIGCRTAVSLPADLDLSPLRAVSSDGVALIDLRSGAFIDPDSSPLLAGLRAHHSTAPIVRMAG